MYLGPSDFAGPHDAVAYDAAGRAWNGTVYVDPPADSAASIVAYRVPAVLKGIGRWYGELPAGAASWELRARGGTWGTSSVEAYGAVDAQAIRVVQPQPPRTVRPTESDS
ncbi:MAG: hypothetical protein JWO31_1074 [Phycisphaerales bacterium]|nr:hypothetical protein [Phycisphaerales bacterium]